MPDRLEALLTRAAANAEYPAAPPLRSRVLAEIARRDARPRAGFGRWRIAVVVAATLAAVALAVSLALPGSRSALADFFGVRHSSVSVLPPPAPGVTPTPFPTPVGLELIGRAVSADEAQRQLGFPLPRPASTGEPDAIYLVQYDDANVPLVVLSYPGYDLWVARQGDGFVFGKGLQEGAVLDTPSVRGQPAAWIAGGSHVVTFADAQGTPLAGTQRTVERNTLVWNTTGAFYRLETNAAEPDALRLAATLP